MKKRNLLIGLGLLALPVVLLSSIYFDRLERGYREIFPPNDPLAYQSKSLKCKISFTNQMFLDDYHFEEYHFNPNGYEDQYGKNTGLPYLKLATEPSIERRTDNLGRVSELPKNWPEERSLEIELNPNLESWLEDGLVIVTNTGKETIQFSTLTEISTMWFIFDERGRLWYLGDAGSTTENFIKRRDRVQAKISNLDDYNKYKKIMYEAQPSYIEPQESIPYFVPDDKDFPPKELKLKASIFFVILGENDKIIHIFETPCEK